MRRTIALLVALAPGAAHGAAGDLVWFYQGIQDVNVIEEIEDQDSDGVADIVLETYDSGATGDHLVCVSGGSSGPVPATIWSTRPLGGPSHSGGWGDECMRIAPDLTGDGVEDVLLGTAWGGRTAYAIDGTSGAVHWDFDTYAESPPVPPVSGWVYTMSPLPDVDGDGYPDVVFGCGSDNNRAYHCNGNNGALFWSQDLGDAIFASAGLEDVTGDGKADVAIGVGDNAPAVWCMRGGAAGSPVAWSRPLAGSCLAVAAIDDLSGDSVNDVLAGTWDSSVLSFDGATGDTLWESVFPGFAYVQQIAVLDDVNGDSEQDAAIGTWDDRVFVLSGLDGTEIWSFPTGGDVWTVSRSADVTGDGVNDVVAGSFDGRVYMLDGVDGVEVWSYDTGNRLYCVRGVSDLTGNGRPDVAAGTQMLSSGPPGGRAYLIEGGEAVGMSADLPMFVDGVPGQSGILVRLRGASGWDACFVERHEDAPNAAAAAQRFRREIAEAYRDGLLGAEEAMAARSQDPRIQWTKVSAELAIRGGGAEWLDASAEVGRSYSYRFALLRDAEVAGYSPVATLARTDAALAIPQIRTRPNPAGAENVSIEFRVPRPQAWTLAAFDAAGRRVAEVDRRERHAGDVRVEWDGRGASGSRLPDGVYFLRLEGEDFVASSKVTLIR